MNYKAFLISLIVFISLIFDAKAQNFSAMERISELYVGMPSSDFEKIFTECKPKTEKADYQGGVSVIVDSINGTWTFNIKNRKLNWYMFNSYSDDITENQFKKYLAAYNELKKQLESKYGKAKEEKKHDTEFKDPYIKRHWGYSVIESVWVNDKMKIKLEFKFMGGKGDYNFLLKVEFQDKDYEFF